MDHSRNASAAGIDGRLSKLGDGVLGRILSFLPSSNESARAAALSSRWRDVFAAVHTVSLQQPEGVIYQGHRYDRSRPGEGHGDPSPAPFASGVSAALLARHRCRGAAAPMRALRVAFDCYAYEMADHASAVDQWISYAVQQCAPEGGGLHLDLRFRREGEICARAYCSPRRHQWQQHKEKEGKLYAVPRAVFSCAALRTLCLGPCKLDPPPGATGFLPSLETLLLIQVADSGAVINRLVAGCPRLADLTLEACDTLTALVLDGTPLCRLALRCCHELATVAIDGSELRAFEYRGAVPGPSFLAMRPAPRRLLSCSVDICGEELMSQADHAGLCKFLCQFAKTEHLQLTSARLGSGINSAAFSGLPVFTTLRHLELTSSMPHDDTSGAVFAAVVGILEHAPSLEVLTLFFKPQPPDKLSDEQAYYRSYKEEELLDAHHLRYDSQAPHSAAAVVLPPPCLSCRVREISLVHYQGGDAQRTLAKFLLVNVGRLDALFCGFAEGPLWIQNKLMDEIRGWAVDKIEPDETVFM